MLVIVTGTIKPNIKIPYLTLKDPEIRLDQYIEGLKNLVQFNRISKVVFVENSNFNGKFIEVEEAFNNKGIEFEVLQFQGNEEEGIERGKGYGEGESIEYALNNSKIIGDAQYFYKITGRYIIENFDEVIEDTDIEKNYFFMNHNYTNTCFFGVRMNDYKQYLMESYKEVQDNRGVYIEHLIFRDINKNALPYNSFKIYPSISGQSGTNGRYLKL